MTRPGEIYWKHIEPIWELVSIYDGHEVFRSQFERLTRKQQHLLAAHWCWSEVCNGGFHQFFTNPTGVLAPEALEGLRAIGPDGAADAVREAFSFFETPYPREQMQRIAILEAIPGRSRREWDPFFEIDSRFYEAVDSLNEVFARAADSYASSGQ